MKTQWISILSFVATVLLALACSGGGSSTTSAGRPEIRFKGGLPGDTLVAKTLNGAQVATGSFDDSGVATLSIPSDDYSVQVILKVDGVELFETLVTAEELYSAAHSGGSVGVTLNAATTILSREIKDYFSEIYAAEVLSQSSSSNDDSTSGGSVSNDDDDYGLMTHPSFSTAAKPRLATESSFSSLSSLLSSMYGVSSISSFSLYDSKSISDLAGEIKMYTYLSAMALKVADEGTLTESGWTAILTALDDALSAAGTSQAPEEAADLASLIQGGLMADTLITVADFGDEMLAFLGDSESVQLKLQNLQSGDTAGAWALLASSTGGLSATSAYNLALAALVDEDILEAYEAASVAVALDPTHDQARLVSALTRMASVGIKNNAEVKAFQKAANLEYTFVDNDTLEDILDEDAPEDRTIYSDADQVTTLPTLEEINSFVEKAYLADIEASIADLEAIDLNSFSGFTLTVAMQGYDEESETYNASSDVRFDTLDVKALLGSMYLLKSHAEYYLGQNLTVNNVNTSGEGMLDFAYDLLDDEPKVTGTGTMEMSWVLDSGSEVSSSDSFVNGTLSLEGGFPGELFITNFFWDDGEPIDMEIFPWDPEEQAWLIQNYAYLYDDGTVFKYAFYGRVLREVDGTLYYYTFDGGMTDVDGEWRWTIVVEGGSAIYNVTSTPTGSLAKDADQDEITDTVIASWIDDNSPLGTITSSYMESSRSSLIMSAQKTNTVLDELQALDPMIESEARLNQFIETPDDLEFDNEVRMSDSELDGLQTFIEGMVNAFSASATVDASVFDASFGTAELDLTDAFDKPVRDFLTDSSDEAILDSEGVLLENEAETDARLDATITSGNLFGFSSGNTDTDYEDFFGAMENWLEDGDVNTSSDEEDDITNGLIAYFPLDGNPNNSVGSWGNATENGNVQYSSGAVGQAASFDGDSYLKVSNIDETITEFTVSFFMKADDFPDWYTMPLSLHTGGAGLNAGDASIQFFFYGPNESESIGGIGSKFTTVDSDEDDDGAIISVNDRIGLDTWYHIVLTRESTGVRNFYIDGSLISTVTDTDGTDSLDLSDGLFEIGAPNFWNSDWISNGRADAKWVGGDIDEVRIYSRALSASEVSSLND